MSLIDKLKDILAAEEELEAAKTEEEDPQPVPEVPEVSEDKSEELELLKAKLAELESEKLANESKIAELESAAESDKAALRSAEAKAKLDSALQAGWLTPAMLKESEKDDSVFVTLANYYPELFDRLQLVMSPKVLKKPGMTEAPADNNTGMSEEELVKRVKQLATEKNISYAEAAQLI